MKMNNGIGGTANKVPKFQVNNLGKTTSLKPAAAGRLNNLKPAPNVSKIQMNYAKDKYGPAVVKVDPKSNAFNDRQKQSKDADDDKLRGLFGYPNQFKSNTDGVKNDNRYLDEFENLFLKPNAFDDNGLLKNLNEEFIRQEFAQPGENSSHFAVKEFMNAGFE